MSRRALRLGLVVGAVLFGLLALAQDRPPTLMPCPGRFEVAGGEGSACLVDRWTGRSYWLIGGRMREIRRQASLEEIFGNTPGAPAIKK